MPALVLAARLRTPHPVAVPDSGHDVLEGATITVFPFDNDTGVEFQSSVVAQLEDVTVLSGPVTIQIIDDVQVDITGGSTGGVSMPYQISYRGRTAAGGGPAGLITGNVLPLTPDEAVPIGQWELDSLAGTDSIGGNTAAISGAQSGDSIVTGGGGSMICNLGPFAEISDQASYHLTAMGVTIYGQVSSLPALATNRQILNKDAASHPNGWTIEHWNVGSVSKINGYMRDNAGSVAAGRFAATGTGVANLPLNTGFMVTITFDPADNPKCRMFLRLAGGAVSQVGSIVNNGGTTLANNTRQILAAIYNGFASPLDGALQRLIVWSGAPTLAQLQALPAPQTIVIDPPVQNNPPIAVNDVFNLAGVDAGGSLNLAANDTNAAAAVYAIQGSVSGTGSIPTVQISTSDFKTATVTRVGTGAGTYSCTVRATNPDAQFDDATLSGSVAAVSGGGFTPRQFVTTLHPAIAHPTINGVNGGRPLYNAADPRSRSFIDPMGGLEVFRITGDWGQPVFRNGNIDTGFKFGNVGPLVENNPRTQRSWNADGTLLACIEYKDYGEDQTTDLPICQALIFDVEGTRGAGPWQILRASDKGAFDIPKPTAGWVWDWQDPLHAWQFAIDGIYSWWPVGGDGHSVGERTKIGNYPSGFTFNGPDNNGAFRGGRAQLSHAGPGRYMHIPAKRNSDGAWGGIRIDLQPDPPSFSSFVMNPAFGPDPGLANDDNDRGITSTGATGTNACFQFQGSVVKDFRWADMITGAIKPVVLDSLAHEDYFMRDDNDGNGFVDYDFGERGTAGWWEFNQRTNTMTQKVSGENLSIGHPSTRNFLDTWERHGLPNGSPTIKGLRYVLCERSTNSSSDSVGTATADGCRIYGVRVAKNDVNQYRYICCPRSVKSSNRSSLEQHPAPHPDMKYVAFNSNWILGGKTGALPCQQYIVVIPDAWYSPNNSGL